MLRPIFYEYLIFVCILICVFHTCRADQFEVKKKYKPTTTTLFLFIFSISLSSHIYFGRALWCPSIRLYTIKTRYVVIMSLTLTLLVLTPEKYQVTRLNPFTIVTISVSKYK